MNEYIEIRGPYQKDPPEPPPSHKLIFTCGHEPGQHTDACLRTDIAGAAVAGIGSLFIAGGIHADEFSKDGVLDPERIAAALNEDGLRPVAAAARFIW